MEVIQQEDTGQGRLDLAQVLDELARWQCNEVLVEAGQTLSGAFLQAGLVDELALFYAGSILGEQGRSMFEFEAALPFDKRLNYQIQDVAMLGDDIRVNAVKQSSVERLNS
jgi:diaminohydroxyphosphoribosylaminopyrimidine deaminase/5-amino-6-(5-phosphoribosylamino)uracil reductase